MRVLPTASRRLRQGRIASVQVVHAGAVGSLKSARFVAVPILPVRAATPGADGDEVSDLDQLKPEAIWAAPAEWCPNPAATISLRVVGNSMSPLVLDGYIIAVDTSNTSRDDLVGQIVVVQNTEEKRLLVSRLIRFDHTDALVSDQREYQPVLLANGSSRRIIGRVLWWTGKAIIDTARDKLVENLDSRTYSLRIHRSSLFSRSRRCIFFVNGSDSLGS
jgi:SOS-response transcriptional repressor LexA